MNTDDSELINQVKRSLDDSVDHMDAGLRSRLTRARNRALDQKENTWFSAPMQWVGVATVATACLIVLLVDQQPGPQRVTPLEDVELLASADQLELYEDLEFYTWLAEEEAQNRSQGEFEQG